VKRRNGELIFAALLIIFSGLAYLGKVSGWHEGFIFSGTVSLIVLVITALSLVWMMVRTIKGKLVERRVVFLYVGIAIALPLFMSISQEIGISDEVREVYDAVMELPPGSKVLVSFDFDPPSAPELQPMAEAFITVCFQRDLKVIIIGLWPQGPQQANMALDVALARPEIVAKQLEYGVDYVNLGYQAGAEFVIQRMGTSFQKMFKTDYRGRPYEDIPLVKNVRNFSNIDYSLNLSAGFVGTVEWVQVAVDRYGLRMGAGLADLEAKATRFMLSQSLAHVIVIAFVLIGNVAYFMSGRKSALRD